ncbi:thioredoxin family protein [Paenibacillus urinalis]|uniref:Thioredoxin family protein n=1 Tax=Paenibacillus urinalis TaxID=521520 RepID=A0AAX3MWT4_9BACL|nr:MULTISPECIES: thioredoxin family protein [Paenibacillus]WDH82070.1 thioredoxin family protein [Paenibacillus urinalis]WDH98125.1 thioredoxin family protein [Paenibacillus urinalis]WDI01808.1 thioredoxin family protein [Paenibacillus urinalis]GAK42662.1 thiol-disulfide isomerase [Paenibacillus sp. TCA20]
MERIQTEEQYRELIQGDKLTVIKFDTTWCPDCKNMDRFIGDVIDQHQDKEFYAIDAEKLMPVADENQVRGIPSLLVFKNGEKIAHLHSKWAKTPAQVSEYLETLESKQ